MFLKVLVALHYIEVCNIEKTVRRYNLNSDTLHFITELIMSQHIKITPLLTQKSTLGANNDRAPVELIFAVIKCNHKDINKTVLALEVRRCSLNHEILHCHITAQWGRKVRRRTA